MQVYCLKRLRQRLGYGAIQFRKFLDDKINHEYRWAERIKLPEPEIAAGQEEAKRNENFEFLPQIEELIAQEDRMMNFIK